MKRPPFEVADIIRAVGSSFINQHRSRLNGLHLKVLSAIERCRTAALGGHRDRCTRCGFTAAISYNSCRNRHCPKCRTGARDKWLAARESELLPVAYVHVVFTIPRKLAEVAFHNKRLLYGLLFRSSAATLLEFAADPKHLGAEIGFLSVLHTWGQNLLHHPHVHCVIPAGGLSPDHTAWISPRYRFFLPVEALSIVFRGKFVDALEHAYRNGKLCLPGALKRLRQQKAFRSFVRSLHQKDWVVYAKPPFGGPRYVLHYLARYTHRVAISNHRLVSFIDGKVTFRWKDYAHGAKQRLMTLTAVANKKAAWYEYNNAMDLPPSIATDAQRRNKKVLGRERSKLIIDPGKKSVEGASQEGPKFVGNFEAGSYKEKVYLGELRTDEQGRLLFLGGHGRSDSPEPSNPISNFSNNDGWHDDISDGPVTARVTLGDGRTFDACPSWVACAPPNYAPGITPMVTMWDLIRETTDAPGLVESTQKPDFARDIYPILQRFSAMQWVAANVDLLAGWQAELDFLDPDYVALLAENSPKNRKAVAARRELFDRFRDPSYERFQPDKLPVMLGDGVDYPDAPRSLFAVLPTQYEMLRQWSKGNFTNRNWRRSIKKRPEPLEDYPVSQQPEMLDRGALEPMLGGAFHPGIELTWPMRQKRLYQGPFRLNPYDPKVRPVEDYGPLLTPKICMSEHGPLSHTTPGDLTKWMGVPWQSDAASCQDVYVPKDFPLPVWWPAILPIDVLPDYNYRQIMDRRLPAPQRTKFFGARRGWDRGVGDVGYHAAGGYSEAMIHMVNDWKLLGFVVERTGPRDAKKVGLPADIYVETEREELEA